MKKKFTEEQIAFALKQAENGTPVAELIIRLVKSYPVFALFLEARRRIMALVPTPG